MERESEHLNTSTDATLTCPQESTSIVPPLQEPFLEFDPISELSFKDQSKIYCSLIALVKAEHPFDNILQDRAAQFLKSLEPDWNQEIYVDLLVTELVPSSAGSHSGFVDSILTLLSSPHSTVVAAAMSLMMGTTKEASSAIRCCFVESDIVTKVIATLQPHTMPISGNRAIFSMLAQIICHDISLAEPYYLNGLHITAAVDRFNRREMIFQKVVLPSSQFVTFLISKRNVLIGDLFRSFMILLDRFIEIGPFHRPTLEFILASPIVMTFSSCLSFIGKEKLLDETLGNIRVSTFKWKKEGTEVVQSGKRMLQALFSEGFEDTLEQKMKHNKSGIYSHNVVTYCSLNSQKLGSNVEIPE
ncbi:hypothetical protein BLNAU_23160 [Blattamonas nauphoetae]|uniref:Uncharacterized protein n=1 Tax=Blattamonas nauphoetae TaxID=2049346 RepID=A0ABQ9WR10_9EUKA|nr:hypothetical protein BLNAU_23160 [Blattamonas nauphoetae]